MQTSQRHRRRGSMYVAILGCAMIVTVIGLSALMATRVERQYAQGTGDFAQARLYAQSTVEMGFHRIANDPNWRSTYPNGVWETDQPIGQGTYTLEGIDPNDAELNNDDMDPVVLTGIGEQGDTRYKLQVTLTAVIDPIEALRTAVHAGSMIVMTGKSLTATGAPASTNGLLQLDGGATVTGDVEAGSLSNGGTITGTITVPAPAKNMPDPGVFDMYAGIATPSAAPDIIDKAVFAPGYNPWGATNTDGVYLITKPAGTLTIQDSRIQGTLVVQMNGGTVVLDKAVLVERFRPDYPTLIVNGDVELLYPSDGNSLSESILTTNFNPTGAPYQGVSDDLQDDTYPSEIQGLVHVTGTLRLKTTARVRGVVICESALTADDNNEIVYDPDLYANPPWGYTTPPVMKTSPGTWRRVVD